MNVNGLSLLFPDQDRVAYRMISEEAWHDLGMDAVTEKLTAKPQEQQLIEQAVGLPGNMRHCTIITACPRSVPRDRARFKLVDNASCTIVSKL